jgi:hypothetical protein
VTGVAQFSPLTATDCGSFLAASAALEAPYAHDTSSNTTDISGFHATTATAASVRNVLERLPTELIPAYPSQTPIFNNNNNNDDNNTNFLVHGRGVVKALMISILTETTLHDKKHQSTFRLCRLQ